VLLGQKWVVVDPAFRRILRSPEGGMLTQQELAAPRVWSAATEHILGYSKAYTYGRTEHVHLARLGAAGQAIEHRLNHLAPAWAESPTISLLFERRSRAALCVSVAFLLFFALCRAPLGWLRRVGGHQQ